MKDPIITRTAVAYSQSRKINLGNYESVDVFASATFESVEPGSEAILYAKAADFVEEKLKEEVAGIQGKPAPKVAPKKAEAKDEKPKKKKTKVAPKKEAESKEEDGEVTLEVVKQALKDYSAKYNKDAAKAIIQNVTGQPKMKDIKEKHFADILLACEEPPVEEDEDFDD